MKPISGLKRLAILTTLAIGFAQPVYARSAYEEHELAAAILFAAYCLVADGSYTQDQVVFLVALRYRQEGIRYLLGAPSVAARATEMHEIVGGCRAIR